MLMPDHLDATRRHACRKPGRRFPPHVVVDDRRHPRKEPFHVAAVGAPRQVGRHSRMVRRIQRAVDERRQLVAPAPTVVGWIRRHSCTNPRCRVHDARAGYRLVEFDDWVVIERSETGLKEAVWFGCLTAGLDGRISEFTSDRLRLVATNEPIVAPRAATP